MSKYRKSYSSSSSTYDSPKKGVDAFVQAIAIVAFVADCIAIFLFIRDLFRGVEINTSERTLSLGIVIILAFVLSISLVKFSGYKSEGVFVIFGMVYAVYSAVIFGLGSRNAITYDYFDNAQAVLYLLLGAVVAIFSYIVSRRAEMDLRRIAIPFIVISIIQIAAVIITLFNDRNVSLLFYVFLGVEIGIVSLFFRKNDDY